VDSLETLKLQILKFRDDRDWKQFHNPKDLSISIALEAAELLEYFQWKSPEEVKERVDKKKEEIGEEMADILNYLILLAHELDIDLIEATSKKIEKSDKKYPVEKSKGTHKKYTEL
jgi:NTP pyrophosphatase (non-canonical NTP hydrolase)